MAKVTKKKFKQAHESYPPNWWIRFIFKHFSKNSKDKTVKNIIVGILILLFIFGIFNGVFVLVYSLLLLVIVLSTLSAVILNNRRLKKIRDYLGVTRKEYQFFHNKFCE